ncbi:MAG: FkbM family methyltransferase [Acidimicrobiales bacterium]
MPDRKSGWAATKEVAGRLRDLLTGIASRRRPGLPLSDLLPILYPSDGRRPELLAAAEATLEGRDRAETLADVRAVLGAFDHQAYPSPVSVRLCRDDIFWHEDGGIRFALDPQDGAVTPLVLAGNFERHITAVVHARLRSGSHVVDVGANVGYHAIRLASLVGPSGSVLAVEPNPDNCRLLQAAVEENGLTNVTLLPVGLGAARGWRGFTTHVGTNGGLLGDESRSVVRDAGTIVPLLRLDDLVVAGQRVDLVKIDVEGAEGLVTDGASETIARCRPLVVSELSFEMLRRVSGVEPRQYLSRFTALDYEINVIERDEVGKLTPYASADDLLARWPSEFHIEDLLLVPH